MVEVYSHMLQCFYIVFPYKPVRKELRDVWIEGWNYYVELT